MDWYALHVVTGREEYIEKWIQMYFPNLEMTILIPKRKVTERRQGKTQTIYRKIFPGYVLMNAEMNVKIYYVLKRIPKLIRILSVGEEYYTKISQEEMSCILNLIGEEDVINYSKIYLVNSRVVIKSGPLKGMESLIKSIDLRKQRARIIVQFMGLAKEINVGIEVLGNF